MKVINKLKEWYTLEEASMRFSEIFSEAITVGNILEFVSTGKIDLFWHLSSETAIRCEYYQKPTIINGKKKDANKPYKANNIKTVDYLSNYYRFSVRQNPGLKSFCRQAIKHFKRYGSIENFAYDNNPFDVFVMTNENQESWFLVEQFSDEELTEYGICSNLPWDSVERYAKKFDCPEFSELVITKQEIERFETSSTNTQNLSVSTKERNTLLKIILGMSLANYAYNPFASRSSTVRDIVSSLALHGIKVDEDTIRKWLNEAKEQLPDGWEPQA